VASNCQFLGSMTASVARAMPFVATMSAWVTRAPLTCPIEFTALLDSCAVGAVECTRYVGSLRQSNEINISFTTARIDLQLMRNARWLSALAGCRAGTGCGERSAPVSVGATADPEGALRLDAALVRHFNRLDVRAATRTAHPYLLM